MKQLKLDSFFKKKIITAQEIVQIELNNDSESDDEVIDVPIIVDLTAPFLYTGIKYNYPKLKLPHTIESRWDTIVQALNAIRNDPSDMHVLIIL
jgi:hypothetical protein